MKKIMFNDKYGLTEAVLKGNKTMTRRICKQFITGRIIYANEVESVGVYSDENLVEFVLKDGGVMVSVPPYKTGEVVAVAQSYKDLGYTKGWVEQHIRPNPNANCNDPFEKKYPGWFNKMFVPAELNKAHKIRITDINVEWLQDISEEDCLKEGVYFDERHWVQGYKVENLWNKNDRQSCFRSAKAAFAALIERPGIGHKGDWSKNPYVFVSTFELIR